MSIANYIVNILRANPNTVLSWGINSLDAHSDGVAFNVQGFKFKGQVAIVYNEGADLFDLTFQNENGVEKIDGVYVEELVDVIDRHVEYTGPNYKKDVDTWLRAL